MKSWFNRNLKCIGQYVFNFEKKKKNWSKDNWDKNRIQITEEGTFFLLEDRKYQLISEDPLKEVEFYVKNIDWKKDNLVVVFGIWNTYLLRHLANKLSKESRILVVEPDVQLFYAMLDKEDISDIFKNKNVVVCVNEEFNQELKRELDSLAFMKWENLIYNMHVLMHPNYHMHKQFCYEVTKYLREVLRMKITVLGNCMEDAFNGFSNIYKNVDAMFESNCPESYINKYRDYPGIVVASGPSLEKNIKELKKANGKAFIVACDASVEACKANGIELDAVASIERDEPTYMYYYKDKVFPEDLVLVGPTVLWPKIYEEYKGKKIIMSKADSGPDSYLPNNFDNVDFENIGMSSANTAFRLAQLVGCNPIILVGQDLAYTDDKKHSDCTHTEFEGENDTSEFDGNMVEDIYGNMIKTDIVYNLFRTWFEMRINESPALKVIDATEGGAKIRGTEIATLKETIEKYCVKEKPCKLYDYLEYKSATKEEKIAKYEELIRGGKEEIKSIREIQKMAEEHYELLEELYDTDIEKQSERELVKIVRKMEKGNQIIADIESNNTVCTIFRPIIKQTITHVKALGNELTGENVLKNLKLQGNLMGMVMRSCGLIEEEFRNMMTWLKEKKESAENE